jgi:CRISPR-associated exonuclease Cas4
MEHTSDIVTEGKLIGETSFQDRSKKFTEIEIDGVKIDFYDTKNKTVHEVKKSTSVEYAHIAQLKYYLYKLTQKGIESVRGILEYPLLKQRQPVVLVNDDMVSIPLWEAEIEKIAQSETCPDVIHAKLCKSCSYYDFCYSAE